MNEGKILSSSKGAVASLVVFATVALACMLTFMVGCAPKASSEGEADAGAKAEESTAVALEWTPESDCVACHTEEAASMANADCPQASMHADMQCVQCHMESDVLATAHEGVTTESTVASKATVVSVNAETCQAAECHGSMEDMGKKTDGKVFLVDSNGNKVNPHDYGSNAKHDETQPTCTDCHKIHSEDTQQDAMKWCAQCHHRGVLQCGTCHEVRDR